MRCSIRSRIVNRLRIAYLLSLTTIAGTLIWLGLAPAHSGTSFSAGEIESVFRFDTVADDLYRIESSTDLIHWQPLRTIEGTGSSYEFSAPPATGGKLYFRATALAPGTDLTGDYFASGSGPILIHPVDHASFVIQWDGKTIYNDPVGGAGAFEGIPPADLILVGHRHGDHYNSSTLEAIRTVGAQIVAPQDVFDRMTSTLQAMTTVLANGETTNLIGLSVAAVPAYNSNHPEGRDNGYVLTIGGTQLYLSGDTGDIAEMRTLQNIDIAFVAMNIPFTMSVDQAASAVRDFKPKVIYPYHYRNQGGSFADLGRFRQLVGDDVGVEVRLRDWYQ